MKRVLRKDLQLETCGQKAEGVITKSHDNGCYIRFSDKKVKHSKERDDCIVDYDNDGNIVGIEFYDGL